MIGTLTIRGNTKTVELDVEYGGGTVRDPYRNTKAGFEINGKLDRKVFGLIWSVVSEASGIVVSELINLNLYLQFIRI